MNNQIVYLEVGSISFSVGFYNQISEEILQAILKNFIRLLHKALDLLIVG